MYSKTDPTRMSTSILSLVLKPSQVLEPGSPRTYPDLGSSTRSLKIRKGDSRNPCETLRRLHLQAPLPDVPLERVWGEAGGRAALGGAKRATIC